MNTLRTFHTAAAHRRCLVPANGFYEWQTVGRSKQPYLFTLRDKEPFAFAGRWEPAADRWPETYCILTTEPNELVARVHTRMPVLLTAETMGRWLDDQPLPEGAWRALFVPLDLARMQRRPVNQYVGNTHHQRPRRLKPPGAGPGELELDFGGGA